MQPNAWNRLLREESQSSVIKKQTNKNPSKNTPNNFLI